MSEVRYNVFPVGFRALIEGNLGGDIEVKTLDNGNTVMKFSIAYPAGSKKGEDGKYENQSKWASINCWGNVPGADKILNLINNPPFENAKPKKGHKVVLEALVVTNERTYQDKAYVDFEVKEVLGFHKVMTMAPKQQDNDSHSGLGDLPVSKTVDNF